MQDVEETDVTNEGESKRRSYFIRSNAREINASHETTTITNLSIDGTIEDNYDARVLMEADGKRIPG